MQLHAFITQALPPQDITDGLKIAQLPGCSIEDTDSIIDNQTSELTMALVADKLGLKLDPRFDDVKKATER